ncbi:MAG: penicillin-binding protein 2 [Candidatus Marinimicrobia bacterium]|nr:penicillin-binding protein 2 [Candidatus Neomarinimicrobiota bacterium]
MDSNITKAPIFAMRGNIFDRNGAQLTDHTHHYSIAANPNEILKPQYVADVISMEFDVGKSEILETLSSDKSFVWLARNFPKQDYGRIRGMLSGTQGIIFKKFNHRTYPHHRLASQIIGFTSVDNNGLEGLEQRFHDILCGTPGYQHMKPDGNGKLIVDERYTSHSPVHGSDIHLTIDLHVQSILEDELSQAFEHFDAEGTMGLVINPNTGEILAMAGYPSFDPNTPTSPEDKFLNPIISSVVEPGSTIKPFVIAAVLENNLYEISDSVDCQHGSALIFGRTITDWKHGGWGNLSVAEVVENSSNVGIVKIGSHLGKTKLYDTFSKFGFGIPMGIQLDGEESGQLTHPDVWSGFSLASHCFGYEMNATPLQIAFAYAAIANGGKLMKPCIIQKVENPNGKITHSDEHEVIRQVITSETAKKIQDILVGVVENGTGKNVKIPGLSIAGKTGTTKKLIDGKYSSTQHIASFIGFYPAENPEYLAAIFVDNAQKNGYAGGEVAGKVVKAIFQRLYNTMSLQMAEMKNFKNSSSWKLN